MSKELITRKNDLLKHASYVLHDIGKLATMCKGIRFESTESASIFMDVLANTLTKFSYEQFDLLDESKITEHNPNEEPTIDEEAEVTENDLPFC